MRQGVNPLHPPFFAGKIGIDLTVAIYLASTKPISRSAGRSVVAAAAYRSGENLTNELDGKEHNYAPRQNSVAHKQIFVPGGGAVDRAELWNGAERSEKRKDARTGREWVIALPHELTHEQRAELANSFARQLVQRYGVAVDVAVHLPSAEGDDRNHHAHVLTTTRQVSRGPDGKLAFGDKASIELSDKKRASLGLGKAAEEVVAVRQLWERLANAALERAGQEARIDHRSNEAQGLDRVPERHMGPNVVALERKGHRTPTGDYNRQIRAENTQRAQVINFTLEKMKRAVARMQAALGKTSQALEKAARPFLEERQKTEQKKQRWMQFAKGLQAGAEEYARERREWDRRRQISAMAAEMRKKEEAEKTREQENERFQIRRSSDRDDRGMGR